MPSEEEICQHEVPASSVDLAADRVYFVHDHFYSISGFSSNLERRTSTSGGAGLTPLNCFKRMPLRGV